MPTKSNQKAFSLIELMVVIGIIAVIAVISLGSITALQKNSRDAQRQADLNKIKGALQQFYADNNFYPNALILNAGAALHNCSGTISNPACITSKTYLQTTPKDPVAGTTTPYCYTSQVSSNNAVSCASDTPGTCHFYRLHAMLENPDTSAGTYTCDSSGLADYNLELTPL